MPFGYSASRKSDALEILVYLPALVLQQGKSMWLLLPAATALSLFSVAADAAPHGGRAYLRGLWWCLHFWGLGVTVASGWHHPKPLGQRSGPAWRWRGRPSLRFNQRRPDLSGRVDGALALELLEAQLLHVLRLEVEQISGGRRPELLERAG